MAGAVRDFLAVCVYQRRGCVYHMPMLMTDWETTDFIVVGTYAWGMGGSGENFYTLQVSFKAVYTIIFRLRSEATVMLHLNV